MLRDRINSLLRGLKTNDRSKKIQVNVLGSILLKGISILLSLVIVPLTINYISPYQYGVWITISSIIGWLSFFDIGFGNGLKNKFVEAVTHGKHKLAKIYVSTIYAVLAIIISVIWLLAIIGSNFINWAEFLNVKGIQNKDFFYILLIVVTTFAFQFVLGLINTILSAIQRPVITSLINVISQLLVLIGIFIMSKFTAGSILNLSLLTGVVNSAVLIAFSIYLYATSLTTYAPKFGLINFKYAKSLMNVGLSFFILQVISIIYYETNNIIITKTLDPLNVTVYNLAYKYLTIIGMFFSIILAPFWSAFIEARVLKDINWMKAETRKLYKVFLFFVIGAVFLVIASPFVYGVWFGNAVSIPFVLTALMGIWQIINMWNSLHSTLIYGFGKIRVQMIASVTVGMLNIPLTILLCRYWGLSGVVFSQILLAILISWIGPLQLKKLFNDDTNGIWNK